MKSQLIAAVAAVGVLLGSASVALAAMPKDTGGSPGNGSAQTNGMKSYGGSPGNGSATTNGMKSYGGSPGNGSAKKKAAH